MSLPGALELFFVVGSGCCGVGGLVVVLGAVVLAQRRGGKDAPAVRPAGGDGVDSR